MRSQVPECSQHGLVTRLFLYVNILSATLVSSFMRHYLIWRCARICQLAVSLLWVSVVPWIWRVDYEHLASRLCKVAIGYQVGHVWFPSLHGKRTRSSSGQYLVEAMSENIGHWCSQTLRMSHYKAQSHCPIGSENIVAICSLISTNTTVWHLAMLPVLLYHTLYVGSCVCCLHVCDEC